MPATVPDDISPSRANLEMPAEDALKERVKRALRFFDEHTGHTATCPAVAALQRAKAGRGLKAFEALAQLGDDCVCGRDDLADLLLGAPSD